MTPDKRAGSSSSARKPERFVLTTLLAAGKLDPGAGNVE